MPAFAGTSFTVGGQGRSCASEPEAGEIPGPIFRPPLPVRTKASFYPRDRPFSASGAPGRAFRFHEISSS